ncbi:hypothetical protein JBO41_09715 [Enterobacter asburiae]|uniref:hypothetical protein n=1 Tax=Enterobacter asburiae TaxID=61645 RepID=UPI00192CAACB|nr:hypothetical protein [Enterobacter asburiae]MBL5841183.1 hypothetical protein [Enterobacter asburiae]MBL5912403.1 hypothetical protein [Enterobacter asburiae]MBL5916912.1 hypothetical protein [Enterobacter asburiae]MBL5941551.1 hypothetical protein [Enterobacter asburiae]MBL5972019.1 hypothetical protein [Enterobacter asburiae]
MIIRMYRACARRGYLVVMAGVLLALNVPAQGAVGDRFTMKINISGTVVATGSCSFNQGGTLVVDFGEVQYITAGGSNTLKEGYRQALASSMTCTGDTDGSAIMTLMSGNGSSVDFQGHRLLPVKYDDGGVESKDLAVRLLVDNKVQDVNASFAVDIKTPPNLEAEVVQTGNGSSFVSGAAFSANATLIMAFN